MDSLEIAWICYGFNSNQHVQISRSPLFWNFYSHRFLKLIPSKSFFSPNLQYDFVHLISSQFSSHTIIFTDATKKGHLVGAAFIIERSFTHELFHPPPIHLHIHGRTPSHPLLRFIILSISPHRSPFLLVSDSLSALTAISNPIYKKPYCRPLILHIRNSLQWLLNYRNSSVSFLWVPSHSGILGNEAADQLAGSVSTLSPAKPVLPFHDTYYRFFKITPLFKMELLLRRPF